MHRSFQLTKPEGRTLRKAAIIAFARLLAGYCVTGLLAGVVAVAMRAGAGQANGTGELLLELLGWLFLWPGLLLLTVLFNGYWSAM